MSTLINSLIYGGIAGSLICFWRLGLLNPHTAPAWVAALVVAILLYLCFRLVRMVYRWWIALLERWDREDDERVNAIRANHQKLHESDGRNW